MSTSPMSCTIFLTGPANRWINVRSPYSASFVAEARNVLGPGIGGSWDRSQRVWQFDARLGFGVDNVSELCRRHYPAVHVVHGGAPPPAPTTLVQPQDAGHVGQVDAKLRGLVLQVTKAIDLVGEYGEARLHVMRDTANHVFTWRASTGRLNVGDVVKLDGTVKRHDVYRNVSQTVLTRCKVVTKNDAVMTASFLTKQNATPATPAGTHLPAYERAALGLPVEWWAQPWPCGHNDPVFEGTHVQSCAVCGTVRCSPSIPATTAETVEAVEAEGCDDPSLVDETPAPAAPPKSLRDEVGF